MKSSNEPNEIILKEWQNDPKNWKLSFLYYNKKDSRVFPPKRFGVGWTINFANPNSIIILTVLLLVIIVLTRVLIGR